MDELVKRKPLYVFADWVAEHFKTIAVVVIFMISSSWAAYKQYDALIDRILFLESNNNIIVDNLKYIETQMAVNHPPPAPTEVAQ
jgi:hypothetical protein